MIKLSTGRPVAVAMIYLAVGLLGIAAWRNIPIELMPDASLPRLSVNTGWSGASAETVEAFLTSPVEGTIQQIRGVEKVTSVTSEGSSSIDVEFARETDMDFARLDLSERLSTLQEDLPPGVGTIVVQPYVPRQFANETLRAFLSYTITGPYTLEALRAFVDDQVEPQLTQIEGVSQVRVGGGRARLVEIELWEEQIVSLGLTPQAVGAAINGLDLVREAGAVREGDREWTVTIRNRPTSVQSVRDAILLTQGRVVRVSDVARVWDTYEEAQGHFRINGRPAVGFQLYKEDGSNTVKVAEAVKARMEVLVPRLPMGTQVILENDQSEQIKTQLTDLRYRALFAAVVIFLVLLLFLRSFRSAGVVFATIAFSVLIALNLIYFGGLSLNILTLMGLAMGFGLIVDNSIVVLENIYRRWQGERLLCRPPRRVPDRWCCRFWPPQPRPSSCSSPSCTSRVNSGSTMYPWPSSWASHFWLPSSWPFHSFRHLPGGSWDLDGVLPSVGAWREEEGDLELLEMVESWRRMRGLPGARRVLRHTRRLTEVS